MALVSPILFSQRFAVSAADLKKVGLLDPILNSDTKLFIDPLLVPKSANPKMRKEGMALLERRFRDVLELLAASKAEGDAAWRGAYRALNLDESSETGLGYGGSGVSGSSRPRDVRETILRTAKEILTLGEDNPNVIPLMGLFESGVGPDTLSDMTTNFTLPVLCEITQAFCVAHNVPVQKFGGKFGETQLPLNPFHPKHRPVVLVPRDVLRDLPFATDWPDVSRVVLEIDEIRQAVNAMFGDFAKATVSEKKEAVRNAALSSLHNLREILKVVIGASDSYDEQADLSGFYTFREVLYSDVGAFKGLVDPPIQRTQQTLRATVERIVEEFKELVENNNLWELLWHGNLPRHERAAQLLFFAVANVICAVNNIDISPETNSGGGPVDFKFSTGYHGRLLVEVKLSTGRVIHGYNRQLEVYKTASKTDDGLFLLVDVGKMGAKLRTIRKMKEMAEKDGQRASDIVVVDARRKVSASKR